MKTIFFFLTVCALAKIELNVQKSVSLYEHFVEESIILKGKNTNHSSLKKIKLIFDKGIFPHVRIIRFAEGN